MIKRLIGLASIAALAWLPSAMDDADSPPSTLRSSSTAELPQTTKPAIGENRRFSVAEIRWCMGQDVRLQTVRPRLATRPAVDRYNELAADYNRRCNGYKYRESDREEARSDIDGARRLIAAAALEDIQRLNDAGALTTRRAQELLDLLDYDPGVIDGVYGTQTKAAIEAFQGEAGILVDGLLSQELSEHLQIALATRLRPARLGEREKKPARVDVVVLVVEAHEEAIYDADAVSDAHVSVSSDRGFNDAQLTDERGRVELAAVPAGKLDVVVRRNESRSRYTFQITEEPHQEVLIMLRSTTAREAPHDASRAR